MQRQRQQALPEPALLEDRLGEAVKGLPFAPGLFAPFLAGIEAARSQSLVDRESFHGTSLGLKIEAMMVEHHGRWLAVAPLRGVADRQALKASGGRLGEAAVTYVDLKEESNRLMREYRDRTLQLLGWGAVAIAVVLGIGLKSLLQLWPVLVPIVAGLIVVAGIRERSRRIAVALSRRHLSVGHRAGSRLRAVLQSDGGPRRRTRAARSMGCWSAAPRRFSSSGCSHSRRFLCCTPSA